jgi:fibro-slime domain-containing protein
MIPPPYAAPDTWPFDLDERGNKRLHNFSFTSELRFWFQYDSTKTYEVEVLGDDYIWVFINGSSKVQVSEGIPTLGAQTISASEAARWGLKDGTVVQVAVYQAEVQSATSSFRLKLSGFDATSSRCVPQ